MAMARILVVEDGGLAALALERWLRDLGYAVVGVAATGADAICQAVEQRPDVVLMDIRLQGAMDGIAAARQIQAQVPVRIIYISAYGNEALQARIQSTHPAGYLQKPFDPETLEQLLTQVLGAQPSLDGPPE